MVKRFQVFVSSTYEDLIKERQEVMHALLELDCIPAGMELFPAANEDQWTAIKRVIDECDYYILIVAGRYGSTDTDGISYTEKEYRYAIDNKKPVAAFIHQDIGSLPSRYVDTDPLQLQKMNEFLALVKQRMCKYWTKPDELGSNVSRSLVQLIKNHPTTGWVRADQLASEEALQEIVRLSRRVQDLESEITNLRGIFPDNVDDLARGDDEMSISYKLHISSEDGYYTENLAIELSWDEIFGSMAMMILGGMTEKDVQLAIETYIESKLRRNGGREFPVSIDGIDFDTIKIQLRALGLIAPDIKPSGTHWKLTPFGDSYMTQARAIKRSRV